MFAGTAYGRGGSAGEVFAKHGTKILGGVSFALVVVLIVVAVLFAQTKKKLDHKVELLKKNNIVDPDDTPAKAGMWLPPKSRLDVQDPATSLMNTNAMRVLQTQNNLWAPDKSYNLGSDAPGATSAAALMAAKNTGRTVNMNGTPCQVAASNNFPPGTVCTSQWSDAAIGDALGLASVGAYPVTSLASEPGLEKVLSYTFDSVNPGCLGAADMPSSGFAVNNTYTLGRRM